MVVVVVVVVVRRGFEGCVKLVLITADNSNHYDDALCLIIHRAKYSLSPFMWLTQS
jgi:hypothetical protein